MIPKTFTISSLEGENDIVFTVTFRTKKKDYFKWYRRLERFFIQWSEK